MRPSVYVLSTGTELSSGRSIDTNAPYIARQLAERGFSVSGLGTLPDDFQILKREIGSLLSRDEIEIVIMTGGLGPTDDDYTVDVVAELIGRSPVDEPTARRKLELLAKRYPDRIQLNRTERQVRIVEGAEPVINERGLAPGMLLEIEAGEGERRRTKLLCALPGVPQEMEQMLHDDLLSKIEARYPDPGRRRSVFYVYATGESTFQALVFGTGRAARGKDIDPIIQPEELPDDFSWGVTAGPGRLRVFLESEDEGVIDRIVQGVREIFPEQYSESSAEELLHEYCPQAGAKIGTAESCTGGLVGKILTDKPGSSAYFRGGVIAYSNELKQKLLNVPESVLLERGAVSEECAQAMAEGALSALDVDYAVALTGVAGPGGGTAEKPVGLVYVGLAGKDRASRVEKLNYPLDRDRVRNYTAHIALYELYRFMRSSV